jgi:DNA processing protein
VSNRKLLERIVETGAVVSEYPPGVAPDAFRFPARNRIVAALAEAVVVVEGAVGSGSLISADHALDLGRQVFAVPSAVNNPLAEVPLSLIRDGAGLIRGAEDLLLDLGRIDPQSASPEGRIPGLSVAEEAVLATLAGPTLADQVARQLGWDLSDAVSSLVGLELRGLVRSVGGRFERRLVGA